MSVRVADILPADWIDRVDPAHPRLAIGIDPATTTKQKSNPTGIVLCQQVGHMRPQRLVVRLKTGDGDVIFELLSIMISRLRSIGLSVRSIVILATNERFWAVAMRKRLARLAPVELLIEGANIDYLGETLKVKAYLGNLVVNTIDEGYLPLPAEEWLKRDYRSVVKERGTFNAEILADGGHGDCFDASGAALHGLNINGRIQAAGVAVGTFGQKHRAGRKLLNPHAHKFGRSDRPRLTT